MEVEIWPQRGTVPKVSDCSPWLPGQISSTSGFRLTCVRFAAGELVRAQAGKVGGQSPELWSRGASGNHGAWRRAPALSRDLSNISPEPEHDLLTGP